MSDLPERLLASRSQIYSDIERTPEREMASAVSNLRRGFQGPP